MKEQAEKIDKVTPMPLRKTTKRINTYTSTSIGRDKVPVLNELREFLRDRHGIAATHQNIIDFAIDRAWAQREEFAKEYADLDPEMVAYLKLQAKLKAAGRI